MTNKGRISVLPHRRLRLMLGTQVLWLATICLLGGWWGRLLLQQASRIAELEKQTGISFGEVNQYLFHTRRMLFWESSTFFAFLLLVTLLLFGLHWREAKRAREGQAFFASLTHELRTPLTSIRLQAESISEQLAESASPEKMQGELQLVQRLLQDINRLDSQVERTLELARVEGGGKVMNQSLRIKPWTEYFLSSWDEGRGMKLASNSTIGDLTILADPSAVQIILKNLLDNSMRHSGQKTTLSVHLSTEEKDGWIGLKYSDGGRDFEGDPRKLGRLFEKGPNSHGAGVGLYLVAALMHRMGGRVEFSASPKLQTQLWFRAAGGADA